MNDMPETPITLAELIAEGIGATVHGAATQETLAEYLADRGIDIEFDDIGRRAIARSDARRLFIERAEEHAAAQERAAASAADRASQLSYAEAVRRGLAARAQRHRDLMREHPELGAFAVMALDCHEHEDVLDRAGQRRDELAAATRRGGVGVMYRYTPTPASRG